MALFRSFSTKAPRISLIVCVRDYERFLPTFLDSVAAQTFEDWELIVVDFNSSGDVGGTVSNWGHDGRIRVMSAATDHMFEARRAGFEASRGAWILNCDVDDPVGPQALEQLLARADASDLDVVGGMQESVDEAGNATPVAFRHPEDGAPPEEAEGIDALRLYCRRLRLAVTDKIYRRDILARAYAAFPAPWPLQKSEDEFLNLMIFTQGVRFAQTDVVVRSYLQHAEATTKRTGVENGIERAEFVEHGFRFLYERFRDDEALCRAAPWLLPHIAERAARSLREAMVDRGGLLELEEEEWNRVHQQLDFDLATALATNELLYRRTRSLTQVREKRDILAAKVDRLEQRLTSAGTGNGLLSRLTGRGDVLTNGTG